MAAAEVLGLYRAMQKSARRFTNYNVREYVRRKVREEFHKNAGLAGEEAAAAIAKAKAERALIDRQVAVYDMFGSKTPSVIDFVKTRKG